MNFYKCMKLLIKRLTCVGERYCSAVMVIVVGNGHDETSSNLYEADRISNNTYTLENGMNSIILPQAMGK